MDGAQATSSSGGIGSVGGGGGGGPAPFLLKTYDMVDDSSTNEIVSWSTNKNSFVVWNTADFARLLLPTYFKHNNFSSFIRQLNTYGFRKIDPERWEFANEDFVKDQKHLLKNIHRRKPIHSHSHPPTSIVDNERAALDEEIERLSREKASLEANLLRFKQQKSAAKLQLEELTHQVDNMEQRQVKLLSFLEKAVQSPNFGEQFARKIESLDLSTYNKKRRLPQVKHLKLPTENSLLNNSSICRAEFGNIVHQDFSYKLRLELSPVISAVNVVSYSMRSSNEDRGSPRKKFPDRDPKDTQRRTEGLLLTSEEVDGNVSCHLNLTLASSPLPTNKGPYPAKTTKKSQEFRKSSEFNLDTRKSNAGGKNTTSREEATENQEPAAAPARVNDVFWEQFLTERPGSSDMEETSSTYRENPYEEQEDRRTGHMMSRNTRTIEQLTL